ncbi:MAG TPA: sulfite exporter TauE/SafE family protein [Noviherbaspirillum sp.]|uniref:sulfite exporter TauE/SafE family protein n=1 Tax=Noviherbaspirillum sp. TaxID=1926288 RepID=UPI002B46CF5B|nr:sulfite exporter TauE/SafE family protein [Noviherbaspirillum sp.]HJV88009.1 sulfite exporter TauE/SafE family protein [Noviherbaspirillum sp.]
MDHGFNMLIVTSTFTFVLAGFVKGVIGLGLPTVAIGLLGLVMTPAKAASLLVVPSLVTNIWQLVSGPGFAPLLKRFWTLLAGFCVGTWLGAGWVGGDENGYATMLLGVALIAYALLGLSKRRFTVSPQAERRLSPVIGITTGMIAAATGVFVIPAVPYLNALELERDELVQVLGLSFTVSTVALGIVLVNHGIFQLSVAGASSLALLPALAGMFAGQRLRMRVRPETFRTCFFAGILLLGAHLALRHVF